MMMQEVDLVDRVVDQVKIMVFLEVVEIHLL